MKTILNKFPKEMLSQLPRASFKGKIVLVQSESEAEKAVDYLLSQDIVGLDTETRPCFKAGEKHYVSLLQASTLDTCFLFRLNIMGLPVCMLRLLCDESIVRVALSWHDDYCQLNQRTPFTMGSYIELQTLAKEMGLQDMSLQKLYANFLGGKINKSQRLSNWDAERLTHAQRDYAATDAWACVALYKEMCKAREEGYEIKQVADSDADNMPGTVTRLPVT